MKAMAYIVTVVIVTIHTSLTNFLKLIKYPKEHVFLGAHEQSEKLQFHTVTKDCVK